MQLLVLGANSEIAMAVAHVFAAREGANVVLASRDVEALKKKAADLEIRHQVKAVAVPFDATDYAGHKKFYASLEPKPDVVLLAFGLLGDQRASEQDFQAARTVIETNFLGAASILEIAAADMEPKGRGCIIGLSSPAGLRGRQSNYVYGSAKGGLAIFLGGLRHRLHNAGVRVITVFPGFVRTKMTEGMDLPDRLTADPEEVALDIWKAYKKGGGVIYSKWFWRWIMYIIRFLPERIFNRSKL